jgi:uncharacterized damage-inducible protein DinB
MSYSIASHAQLMARYNQKINQSLYAAAAGLSDAERKADQGLFFKSLHGTLNHLLVADRIWFSRFQPGYEAGVKRLDQELFADFDALRQARESLDADILNWANGLSAVSLPDRLQYVSLMDQSPRDLDYRAAIVHFFNHQTHHRGQATVVLSKLGVNYGVTDLPFMPGVVI